MTETLKAWQCIGCGAVEAPQPCVGICEHRKVEFVYAFEHRDVRAEAARTARQARALAALARRIAWTTPREGEWNASWRALQRDARRLLAATNADATPAA